MKQDEVVAELLKSVIAFSHPNHEDKEKLVSIAVNVAEAFKAGIAAFEERGNKASPQYASTGAGSTLGLGGKKPSAEPASHAATCANAESQSACACKTATSVAP